MTSNRYAFIKANWHAEIVDQAWVGFQQIIPSEQIDVFDVPGAFEMPLIARDVAVSDRYAAVVCAAFVVDGGIYRHEFVSEAVVSGLMKVGLDTGIPILSVSLTPQNFQATEEQLIFFKEHFIKKGREAANATIGLLQTRAIVGKLYGRNSTGELVRAAKH